MRFGSSYAVEALGSGSIGFADVIRDVRKIKPILARWRRRRRFRADLRRLLAVGPHMIIDIGLAYGEALRQSEQPFWKP